MKQCWGEEKTARVSFSPGSQRASSPVMICAAALSPMVWVQCLLCLMLGGGVIGGSWGMRVRGNRRAGVSTGDQVHQDCNLSCRPPVTRQIAPFICG
ncbi:hypothetical protein MHYP_G00037200 [Metynnis hypsauchen]